jgi:hypothetical protein
VRFQWCSGKPDGFDINIGPRAHNTAEQQVRLTVFLIANNAKSGQSPNYTILAIPKQKKISASLTAVHCRNYIGQVNYFYQALLLS